MASKREALKKMMLQNTRKEAVVETPVDDLSIIKNTPSIDEEPEQKTVQETQKLEQGHIKKESVQNNVEQIKTDTSVENSMQLDLHEQKEIEIETKTTPIIHSTEIEYNIPKAVSFSAENAMFIRKTSIQQHVSISQFIISIFEEQMQEYKKHGVLIDDATIYQLMDKNNSYGKTGKRLSFFLSEELVNFFYEYQMQVGLKLTTIYNYMIEQKRKALV